ncbi:MAG: class I SAM-dependent methyltransferase [Parvibaculaceae bacterium]
MAATDTQKVWWYVQRPALWPTFARLVGQRLARRGDGAERARARGRREAIGPEEALRWLSPDWKLTSVEAAYPDIWAAAQKRCDECPVLLGGAGAVDLLYSIADQLGARRAVETGVAYGWSSLGLLLAMQGREGAKLASVDLPYAGLNSERYVGMAVPDDLRANWTLLRVPDRDGLPKALKLLGKIDICHYDSDKSYQGRIFAYPLLWDALRDGGVFVSDDIQDNMGFFDFVDRAGADYVVLDWRTKYVGIARKGRDRAIARLG